MEVNMAKPNAKVIVKDLVQEYKDSGSKRFKLKEFELLFYAVLTDDTHLAKKLSYDYKQCIKTESEVSYKKLMDEFLDLAYKHAGHGAKEREDLIASYVYKPKDINFLLGALEEAESLQVESGKALKKWAEKEIGLMVQKYTKTGKYEGMTGYKKKIEDREAKLAKAKTV
jgi:hypothetical protein